MNAREGRPFRVIPVYYEAGNWDGSRKIEWVWGEEIGILNPHPEKKWIIGWESLSEIRLFTTGEVVKINPETNKSIDGKFWVGDPFLPQQIPVYRKIEIPRWIDQQPHPMPRPKINKD